MSKRNKAKSRRNRKNKARTRQLSKKNRLSGRLGQLEALEERNMLSANPIGNNSFSFVDQVPVLVQRIDEQAIDSAFAQAANLSQYSQEQIDNTTDWVIRTSETSSILHLQSSISLSGNEFFETFASIPNTFIFRGETGGEESDKTNDDIAGRLANADNIAHFYPLVANNYTTYSLPNDPYLSYQWHLQNTGQRLSNPAEFAQFAAFGNDLGVEPAWDIATGAGVVVAVVDDGLQYTHPDLAPNFNLALSSNPVGLGDDPLPNRETDFHGTAVAGVLAAAGDNGIGTAGVAYDATLVGIRYLGLSGVDDDVLTNTTLLHETQNIDIYNNSWGSSAVRNVVGPGPLTSQALIDSVFLGRGGLGTIHVFATGNSAEEGDLATYNGLANNRYTIAVGAINHAGGVSSFSESGPSLFVVAPSNGAGGSIVTTDLLGDDGYNETGHNEDLTGGERDFFDELVGPDGVNYTSTFGGTSSAAPVVSGVIALMLEVNPNLTYRDVEHILARSARQLNPDDPGWQVNAIPLFFDAQADPDTNAPLKADGTQFSPFDLQMIGSALLGDPDEGDAPFDPVTTNSAGFTVHDLQGSGYGHGAVDPLLAVQLAQNWQPIRPETTIGSGPMNFGGPAGNIPAVEFLPNTNIPIPGSVGGASGFAEDEDSWFGAWAFPPTDPDELADLLADPPRNTRGGAIEFMMPDNMSMEYAELSLNFDLLPATASNLVRITLISPDGVRSEFTNPSPGLSPITPVGDDGMPADTFEWTFTTNRDWGERSGGNARQELVTPFGTFYTPRPWQIVIDNFSGEDLHIASAEVNFFGSNVNFGTDPSGRVQGIAGFDIDGDDDFNFTGLVDPNGDIVRDASAPFVNSGDYVAAPRERLAAGATIYVDADLDGVRDAGEPFFVTGADGNYYFDLPFGTFTIRAEAPEGSTLDAGPFGVESYVVTIAEDDLTTPENESRVLGRDFLYDVDSITLSGNIFADYDGSGTRSGFEPGASEFVVFVDMNNNGVLDFTDNNFNFVFDPGIDTPREAMQLTTINGDYSIALDTVATPGYEGTGFYTLRVVDRPSWTRITPDSPFYRLHVTAGEDVDALDFAQKPELGILQGIVFNDEDESGTQEFNEVGVEGATVFLDADDDGILGVGELSAVTDSNGVYRFFDLAFNQYSVRLAARPGWEQTAPNSNGEQTATTIAGSVVVAGSFGATNNNITDYGDAPASFATTAAQGGAIHPILPGFHLGAGVDKEADGQPSANADADTGDDGVVFVSDITSGQTASIQVTASTTGGYLNVWFDLNGDGVWDPVGERVITNELLDAGVNNLLVDIPGGANGGTSYARFRYGEFDISSPSGIALQGEVEDYEITIIGSPSDFSGNGNVDADDLGIWAANFGTQTGAAQTDGDADGDGDVDGADFLSWQQNFEEIITGNLVAGSAANVSEDDTAASAQAIVAEVEDNSGNVEEAAALNLGSGVETASLEGTPIESSSDSAARTSTERSGSSADTSFQAPDDYPQLVLHNNGPIAETLPTLLGRTEAANDALRFDVALKDLQPSVAQEIGSKVFLRNVEASRIETKQIREEKQVSAAHDVVFEVFDDFRFNTSQKDAGKTESLSTRFAQHELDDSLLNVGAVDKLFELKK